MTHLSFSSIVAPVATVIWAVRGCLALWRDRAGRLSGPRTRADVLTSASWLLVVLAMQFTSRHSLGSLIGLLGLVSGIAAVILEGRNPSPEPDTSLVKRWSPQ